MGLLTALDGGMCSGGDETAGGGGGEQKRRVATFEPALPDLERHGPRPEDGYIKH